MDNYDFQGGIADYKKYSLASSFLLSLLNSTGSIITPKDLDWSAFLNLVVYHRFTFIAEDKITNIPLEYKTKLKLINKSIIKKNKLFSSLVDKISLEFSKENIDFLLLKGASRLNVKRKMDDIDILINKNDLNKIKRIVSGFMTFGKNKELQNLFYEFRARSKDHFLLVEFKHLLYTPKKLSLDFVESNPLKPEILFCFEAYHTIFHNSFQKARLYYDGYLKLKEGNLSYSKLFEASKLSGTQETLKSYIYVIHKLFHLPLPEKYYSKKDINRAELFFSLNHPFVINNMYDAFVFESFIRISHSTSYSKKIKHLYFNFVKNKLFFDSKKNRYWFLFNSLRNPLSKKLVKFFFTPDIFYSWINNKSYLWANFVYWKLRKRHVSIPFYVFYQMQRAEAYLDLFKLLTVSYSSNLKLKRQEASNIINQKEIQEWLDIGKKYKKESIVRSWLYDLGLINDSESKKWHSYFGFNLKNKRHERLFVYRRKIVLRDQFRVKLFYFFAAIFPSLSRAKIENRFALLKEWLFNIFNILTTFKLFISLFKKIK